MDKKDLSYGGLSDANKREVLKTKLVSSFCNKTFQEKLDLAILELYEQLYGVTDIKFQASGCLDDSFHSALIVARYIG